MATEPGVKDDSGKIRVGLMMGDFSRALLAVSAVTTFGAKKYTPHGWLTVPNGFDRYTDAMLRHQLSERDEPFDNESQMLHAAHVAWNALARLELILQGKAGCV